MLDINSINDHRKMETPMPKLEIDENRIKHLEFIQATINRMASNSAMYKGWALTVNAALAALSADDFHARKSLLIIAAIITLGFSCFDTYYLVIEKKYRDLYSECIKPSNNIPPFSMDIRKYNGCFLKSYFTVSIWPLYITMITALVISYLIF